MDLPVEQVEELKQIFPGAASAPEGETTFFLLPQVILPDGCEPHQMDLLLCPTSRDGYPSRLFFAQRVTTRPSLNWNVDGVRILERNWHAYSWKVNRNGLRLAQLVSAHLRALR